MHDVTLNERARLVLNILVARYIQEGCPIGSKTLAHESALGLSPATIRNILADLEEAGYLVSPHTSAGRVPTTLGYRLFVNSLLMINPQTMTGTDSLQSKLDPDSNLPNLLQSASALLSNLTQLTGVVALPRRNRIKLRQVEFLPLSTNRVLVILILNNREVQNRVIYTDRIYSSSELQEAANYLNTHYVGKSLLTIRKELLHAIREESDTMAYLFQAAVDVGHKAFIEEEEDKDFMLAGQNHLLNYSNNDVKLERLKILFEALTQKQEILTLLEYTLGAEGIQIFIGNESGYEVFDECSIVTTSYSIDGQIIGSLGVIGPIRMPYERVIAAVDVTAKLLSAALNHD